MLLWFGTLHSGADSLVRVANTTLNLPGDPPVDVDYQVVNAFGSLSFSSPIALANAPGDTDHVYVIERGGQMQRVNLGTNTKTEFLDLEDWVGAGAAGAPTVSTGGEGGFLSAAFHPDYQTNGRIFVFYTVNDGGRRQRIAEVTKSAATSEVASHTILINQLDQASNHNGGDLHFGPDGYLYISVGDEGGADDQYNNSNFINKDFFSAILRIDVDNLPGSVAPNSHPDSVGGYKIPVDNPFVGVMSHQGLPVDDDDLNGDDDVRTEIWVTGLRNPFRFSFDETTGECFIADVGQGSREEINIVFGGEDCGWSRREGTIAFNNGPDASDLPPGYQFHDPIHDYNRSIGRSITGGFVYRGSSLPEFQGSYIFADYGSDRLFVLSKGSDGTWSRQTLLNISNISGFGPDPRNGDVLMCRLTDGTVGRLQRTTQQVLAPALLSETGAFSDLSNLTPEAGIYPYEVNHPFWSDHAEKRRWFSIPNVSDVVTFSGNGAWDFPSGQVWVKHFDIETERGNSATSRPLETRFLVKTSTGAYGLSYRWNSAGTDADLVAADGMTEDLSITEGGSTITQTWQYPSRANCLTCHTEDTNFALSFHTRQLNRSGQINELACAGFLNETPPSSLALPAHPALEDATVSREARVRAYLDVNCAMCHRGSESALAGNYDARVTTKTDLADLINGMLVDNLGDTSNRFVVPGDVTHSAVLKRLDATAPRMPPLASNVIDQDAIDLITAWITQDLPSRQSYDEWAVANFGSVLSGDGDFDGDGVTNRLEFLTGTNPTAGGEKFALSLTADQVSFMAPANRHLIIEMSQDLSNWSPLDAAGNSNNFPAMPEMKTLALPQMPELFLRARVDEP